jgi:hypothetical protein
MKTKITLFIILFFSALTIDATNYVVTSGADSGAGTLRQAITDANADASIPHTITFSGVNSIALASALPYINRATTIDGGVGVTITGSSSTTNMVASSNVTTAFKYITFSGAVVSIGGTGTFDNCTFTGGGIGALKVTNAITCNNCLFYANTNTGSGGTAIHGISYTNDVTLNDCIIRDNGNTNPSSTAGGAAIYVRAGNTSATKLTMTNCLVYNNINRNTGTAVYGGGISSGGVTTITNCAIYNNEGNRGGGIALQVGTTTFKSSLTMTDCTVSGNSLGSYIASAFGGGIYIQGGSGLLTDNCSITNCTISGNTTPALGTPVITSAGGGVNIGGGASSTWTSVITFSNCTIYGNNVQGNPASAISGGGIDYSKGSAVINYGIVIGNNSNSTANGRNITFTAGWLTSTTGRNMYEGSASWGGTEVTGNVILTASPTTILNTSLADNGGTTALPDGSYVKTHALISDGLAVNPTAASLDLQTVDQRGMLRDGTPDMGAYEFVDTTTALIKTIDVNNALLIKNGGIEMNTVAKVEVYSVSGVLLKSVYANIGEFIAVPKGISVIRVTTLKGLSTIKFIN